MNKIKTYKQLFDSDHFDSFELIKDYINEFCDTLDLDLYPNDTGDKIYLKTNSNGIFVWRFLDSKWEKTDELKKYYYFIFEIRLKDSFRVPNEDKIKNMLKWLIERIDESEISEGRVDLKFISNQVQPWKSKKPILDKTFTKYEIKFDIIKKSSNF
jgi:hypothetical protein